MYEKARLLIDTPLRCLINTPLQRGGGRVTEQETVSTRILHLGLNRARTRKQFCSVLMQRNRNSVMDVAVGEPFERLRPDAGFECKIRVSTVSRCRFGLQEHSNHRMPPHCAAVST